MGKIDDIIKSSSNRQDATTSFNSKEKPSTVNGNNLLHYCSICKTAVNVELVIYAIAAIIGAIPSYGLSVLAFGLLYVLTIVPQYLIIEIGYNAIKILENQKLANNVSMAEQEMLKDKINSIISKLDDKQEPKA
jgi:hypothetical protein